MLRSAVRMTRSTSCPRDQSPSCPSASWSTQNRCAAGSSSPVQAPTVVSSGSPGAAAAAQPVGESAIERDPTVNRSLMLRLIAGVRGL